MGHSWYLSVLLLNVSLPILGLQTLSKTLRNAARGFIHGQVIRFLQQKGNCVYSVRTRYYIYMEKIQITAGNRKYSDYSTACKHTVWPVWLFALGTVFLSDVYLLFEVASLLLVNQHQVQVVAHRELLVDISHGGSQIVTSQK